MFSFIFLKVNENILFRGHIFKFKKKINHFFSNNTKKLPKMVLQAIFPSAFGLKKERGRKLEGGGAKYREYGNDSDTRRNFDRSQLGVILCGLLRAVLPNRIL